MHEITYTSYSFTIAYSIVTVFDPLKNLGGGGGGGGAATSPRSPQALAVLILSENILKASQICNFLALYYNNRSIKFLNLTTVCCPVNALKLTNFSTFKHCLYISTIIKEISRASFPYTRTFLISCTRKPVPFYISNVQFTARRYVLNSLIYYYSK
jgi:hypothetical protein